MILATVPVHIVDLYSQTTSLLQPNKSPLTSLLQPVPKGDQVFLVLWPRYLYNQVTSLYHPPKEAIGWVTTIHSIPTDVDHAHDCFLLFELQKNTACDFQVFHLALESQL